MSAPESTPPDATGPQTRAELDSPYSNYVLGVLVLVYVFNFLDRQILSILNEEIKRDLGLNDAQMGFLYGTAFAVFYAIFGPSGMPGLYPALFPESRDALSILSSRAT